MRLPLDEFESVTNEAFSYLQAEHGYHAGPVEIGGIHGSGLMRKYTKGNLTITFLFGDADCFDLCSIWFREDYDSIDCIVKQHHVSRELSTLLMKRLPQYKHSTLRDLTDARTPADVIKEYGALLSENAADAIEGDFSGFTTLVYLLIYVDSEEKNLGFGRPIGLFSSPEQAQKAIAIRHKAWHNLERIDGYEVWSMDIDSINWLSPTS